MCRDETTVGFSPLQNNMSTGRLRSCMNQTPLHKNIFMLQGEKKSEIHLDTVYCRCGTVFWLLK